jgi:hypothetical protein
VHLAAPLAHDAHVNQHRCPSSAMRPGLQ